MSGDVVLSGVRRQFGEHVVLDDYCLTMREGAVTALAGPNGSGKTTIARLVLGLDTPDAGTIAGLEGRKRTAVFQENRLCAHLTAVANVRLVLDRADWAAAEDSLHQLGLHGVALETPAGQLSGGQRRRVAIARALAGDAELVVLDEPLAGIDRESRGEVLDYVRRGIRGRTVLLITHDPEDSRALGASETRLLR